MTEHPTLAQELERKTVEELQRVVLNHEIGRLTLAQFHACIDTLWECTSGLVSRETMELITAAKKHAGALPPPVDIRAFVGANHTIVLARPVGDAEFHVLRVVGAPNIIKATDQYGDHMALQQKFNRMLETVSKTLRPFPD